MNSTIINKLTNLVEASESIFLETGIKLSEMIEFIDDAALLKTDEILSEKGGHKEVKNILLFSQSIRKLLILSEGLVKD